MTTPYTPSASGPFVVEYQLLSDDAPPRMASWNIVFEPLADNIAFIEANAAFANRDMVITGDTGDNEIWTFECEVQFFGSVFVGSPCNFAGEVSYQANAKRLYRLNSGILDQTAEQILDMVADVYRTPAAHMHHLIVALPRDPQPPIGTRITVFRDDSTINFTVTIRDGTGGSTIALIPVNTAASVEFTYWGPSAGHWRPSGGGSLNALV